MALSTNAEFLELIEQARLEPRRSQIISLRNRDK